MYYCYINKAYNTIQQDAYIRKSCWIMVFLCAFYVYFFSIAACYGQENFNRKYSVQKLDFGEVAFEEFRTADTTTVRIIGVALSSPYDDALFSYGWILNSLTREVVWIMDFENASSVERLRTRKYTLELLRFDEFIDLPEGFYELYYSAEFPEVRIQQSAIGKFMNKIFTPSKPDNIQQIRISELGIAVFGDKEKLSSASDDDNP